MGLCWGPGFECGLDFAVLLNWTLLLRLEIRRNLRAHPATTRRSLEPSRHLSTIEVHVWHRGRRTASHADGLPPVAPCRNAAPAKQSFALPTESPLSEFSCFYRRPLDKERACARTFASKLASTKKIRDRWKRKLVHEPGMLACGYIEITGELHYCAVNVCRPPFRRCKSFVSGRALFRRVLLSH